MKKKFKGKGIFIVMVIIAFLLVVAAVIVNVKINGMPGETSARNPIEVKQLNENTWLMNDNNESTGYVVVGEDKAAVIDTMNGYEDVQAVARTITDLPIIVINTHGHMDHIYGDAYFGEAYLHPDDFALAEETLTYRMYRKLEKKFDFEPVHFVETKEGDVFDLGGISLEVYEIRGILQEVFVCLIERIGFSLPVMQLTDIVGYSFPIACQWMNVTSHWKIFRKSVQNMTIFYMAMHKILMMLHFMKK